MKGRSLGIVQTHATQIDGPLYRRITDGEAFSLTVYYLNSDKIHFDTELGRDVPFDNEFKSGYTSRHASQGVWGKAKFFWRIMRANHDLIIVAGYSPPTMVMVSALAWCLRIPIGLRSDSILMDERSAWRVRVKEFALPFLFRLYATGQPVGTLAASYLRHYGMKRVPLFMFPYAVDNDYLRELCEEHRLNRVAIRGDLGIAENQVVILGVLKFTEREDPMTLLRGFALVSHESNMHLILVGDGPLRGEIVNFVATHGLKNVHLAGFARYSELPKYFAMADIFVHPARKEQWGVSVNEAMACGVPVIASSAVGAGVDLIRPGQNGYVFQAGDPQSLAKALIELISQRALWDEMAELAKLIANDWSYSRTIHNLERALKHVRT